MLYLSLFFFTPLLMSPFTSELFEFNKMLFIYFIASVVLFFWLFRMILLKKIILKRTKLDLPIFIFLASQLFSTFFSLDFHTSFFGYYGRFNGGLLSIITYLIPAFFITINPSFNHREKNDKENNFLEELTNKQKLLLGILIFFIFYFLFFIFKYWLADYYYAKADVAFKNNQYQLAAFYLREKALKLKYEHVYEDKLSYILANLAFLSYYQKEKDYASYLKDLSIYYNNHSLSSLPKNVLYWKTKAKIYYLFYQMDLEQKNLQIAIEALKNAQILSPTDPKIPYTLAFFESILSEQVKNNEEKEYYKNESLKAIDYAIDLKNDMIDAYLLKGQLLKKYKKINEAKAVYRYILDNLDPQNQEAKRELEVR